MFVFLNIALLVLEFDRSPTDHCIVTRTKSKTTFKRNKNINWEQQQRVIETCGIELFAVKATCVNKANSFIKIRVSTLNAQYGNNDNRDLRSKKLNASTCIAYLAKKNTIVEYAETLLMTLSSNIKGDEITRFPCFQNNKRNK
ncbi:CLUMA_CG011302, isoform A [Clunio marinus]|uniref:CLUMA_CG011302, isoform A n=1 Tax=Clunio marinus TaxID=568069 RepID=A0A1J1IHK4_9DIPT|nr:CLUMA_CG011302, isoform A [Clunio marinus]